MLWRVAQDNLRRLIHECRRVGSTLVAGQCTSISPLQGAQTLQLSRSWASTSHGPVIGACLLERAAVLFPEVPEWETAYREWQREWHGVMGKEYPAWYVESGGSTEEQVYSDDGGIVRGDPAPRRTEADERNDMRSLRRKMDERLFLIVKKGSKKEGRWQFPLAEHVDGETLRGTAERALRDVIGQSCPYWVVGNAPAGHVHLEFGTVFFLRAQILEGMARIRKSSGCTDYAWVTKEEMGSFMDERTAELMVKML